MQQSRGDDQRYRACRAESCHALRLIVLPRGIVAYALYSVRAEESDGY